MTAFRTAANFRERSFVCAGLRSDEAIQIEAVAHLPAIADPATLHPNPVANTARDPDEATFEAVEALACIDPAFPR